MNSQWGKMATLQDTQLEKVIDRALKSRSIEALDTFLQRNINERTLIKCSQHFLDKLDKLVNRSLDQKDYKSASLCLAIIYKCGKNLKVPGYGEGLSGIIAQGLIRKLVEWFEKCRQLWIQGGTRWNETLFNLSEEFFDALMMVHEACKEGTYEITESFLYPLGQLALDARIHILIQKEAIRKFNIILDKMPVELKKERKILRSQEASDIMIRLAGQVLEGGDYDLQTALMEALCRMATPVQRKDQSDHWFSMEHVASAFVKIRDSDFETDCRRFLNLVNGMQGDKRRVYSFPCLEVYLDKHELLMPADEKLEAFWMDFNLGSHSISFYFSLADEEAQSQWETMCINENEVQSYSVTEKGKRQVLQLNLSEVVSVGSVEGSSLSIYFSSSLDILQTTCSVYGHRKNKGFVGKTSTSVVKTTVKIVMEENGSQVIVPESPVSVSESEKTTAPPCLPTLSSPLKMGTPAKMRISESTTFISSSAGGSLHEINPLPADTSTKRKEKPSLEMLRSVDRQSEVSQGALRTADKNCHHHTRPSSMKGQSTAAEQPFKNKPTKHKKSIPLARAANVVPAGEGKELSQEDNFVPDTQIINERDIPSNWSKLSVSEMLMMPTQEINRLPRPELCSSLVKKQEHATLSVPQSGPVTPKQLYTRFTQGLQEFLNEANQDAAPQQAAAGPRKISDVTKDSEGRGTLDRCGSTLAKLQGSSLAEGKIKGQLSPDSNGVPVEAPIKASTTKNLQDRITPDFMVKESRRPCSGKEKRGTEVAGSMVKFISSHYEFTSQFKAKAENVPQAWIPPVVKSRPIFNMSWPSFNSSGGLRKSRNRSDIVRQSEDVFAFNNDAPVSIGQKDTFTDASAISSNDTHNSSRHCITVRTTLGQSAAKEKRHVKKHLFSDTDTDNAMTDASWLRGSNKKPSITKYSRQPPIKPKAASSYKAPDSTIRSPKLAKENSRPNKKLPVLKNTGEQSNKAVKSTAAPDRPKAAARRPQRAAATTTKSYRDPDSDDSQSEPQEPPPTKISYEGQQRKSKSPLKAPELKRRRRTSDEQFTITCPRPDNISHSSLKKPKYSKKRPGNVPQETATLKRENADHAQEQMNSLKCAPAARQASSSTFPAFFETMRSVERSAPTLGLTCSPLLTPRGSPLPASPDPPCRDTLSPILLQPKPHSTVSSKGDLKPSSFYNGKKENKCSKAKAQSIQSPHSLSSLTRTGPPITPGSPIGPSATEQCLFSAPQSPLSLSSHPLLTSTLLELDKPCMPSPPQSPFPDVTVGYDCHYGLTEVSPVSQVSLNQSSAKSSSVSSKVDDSHNAVLPVSPNTEKTPTSDRDHDSAHLHVSGPCRKRHLSLSSNSEDDEKKESKIRMARPLRMKPRRLFKSFGEASADGEMSQVMSSSITVSSGHWEAEGADADMDMEDELDLPDASVNPGNLCQQLSSNLKKKIQSRYKMMEVYNKQSFKTIQQHVSALKMQVTKYRTQDLEQTQRVLLEEIQKVEQEEIVLKNMEKNLSIYWKKLATSFHSYREPQKWRIETLKNALENNMCHSLDCEERIFTSQMCLIRKDMKSVQDRLLSEMQEGEIKSVKRGLHALFFPNGAGI